MKRSLGRSPVALVILAVFFAAACAGKKSTLKLGKTSEGEVVEAEGYAAYNPQDILGTKKASLTDAQRNAVEKVVGVFVSARTMVEKAVAIENNILARTEGYVKKYDILKEGVKDGVYQTKIRALVAIKDLEADLKSMSLLNTPELQRPRLYIDLTETIDEEETMDHAAQMAMEKAFQQQGFEVAASTDKSAAELTITGKADAYPFQSENLGGFVSYRARLSAQAKRPGATDVVASLTKEASGLGGTGKLAGFKSLETVGDLAAQDLGKTLGEKWGKGGRVLVYVEGVKSFSDVDRIKKHLVAQPGVSDVALRLYDEEMAQFEVQLGSIQTSELASRLESSQTIPMHVLESSNQLIRTKLK